MNKIEKAIYEVELQLNYKKKERIVLLAEIDLLDKQLDALKIILKDEKIPNETPKPKNVRKRNTPEQS